MSNDVQYIIGKIHDLEPLEFNWETRAKMYDAIQTVYNKGLEQRMRKTLNERKARKLTEYEWRRKIVKYVEESIEPGMLIKVKGARDGHGIRRVFRKIPGSGGHRGFLQCFQIVAVPNRHDRQVVDLVYESRQEDNEESNEPYKIGMMTEHFYDKVIGIVHETLDPTEWSPKYRQAHIVSIRDILREEENNK